MGLNIINQLKFARSEFRKGFESVTELEGMRRFGTMNSIGWIIGHLAWHEQYYWLERAQSICMFPDLDKTVGFNCPASKPSIGKMIETWKLVTDVCDTYLTQLTLTDLTSVMIVNGKPLTFNIGTMLSRVIYHYWYHNGEMQAIRQMLGHTELPDFVSDDIETTGAFFLDTK